MINIHQMKHQYKQQKENQNKVITEKKVKIKNQKINILIYLFYLIWL
jgi:hypothetical protein